MPLDIRCEFLDRASSLRRRFLLPLRLLLASLQIDRRRLGSVKGIGGVGLEPLDAAEGAARRKEGRKGGIRN